MKKYEKFNKMFRESQTPEERAVGMVVSELLAEHGVEHSGLDIKIYTEEFKRNVKWLNSEAENNDL